MTRARVVASIRELAISLGSVAHGTEWHLFGSVNRDELEASDIDLMILCRSEAQADALRLAIDADSFVLPLHLALFSFDEAEAIDVVQLQQSTVIFR